MNRTLLVLIGILAALLMAAGIMHPKPYNRPVTCTRIEKQHISNKGSTCVSYYTDNDIATYYIRISSESTDEPIAFTTTYKEMYNGMLKSNDNKVREKAEDALRKLGVPEEEIQKAKK